MKTKTGLGMKTTLGLAVLALLAAADGHIRLSCYVVSENSSFVKRRDNCEEYNSGCCVKIHVGSQELYGCQNENWCNSIENAAKANGCTGAGNFGGVAVKDSCVCWEDYCNEAGKDYTLAPCANRAAALSARCADNLKDAADDREKKRACARYAGCATDARVQAAAATAKTSACKKVYAECAAKFNCEDEAAAMKTECAHGLKDTPEDRKKKRACDRYASCTKDPMVMGEKTDETCLKAYGECTAKFNCEDEAAAMKTECAHGLKDTPEDRKKKRACDRYASCTKDPMVMGEKTDETCLKAYGECTAKFNCEDEAAAMKTECAHGLKDTPEDRKKKRACDRYASCTKDPMVMGEKTDETCLKAYGECTAKFNCEDEAAAMKTECAHGLKDTPEDRKKKRACDRYASCANYPMVMGEKTDEACQEAYAACAIKSECGSKTAAMMKSCAFGLKDTAEDRERKRACDRYASCAKDPMVIGEKTDANCLSAYDGCATEKDEEDKSGAAGLGGAVVLVTASTATLLLHQPYNI